MTIQKVIESLNEYKGDIESLNAFVAVANEEFGLDWTEKIYTELGNVPASLKEKLDHAFNYYAATTAWNEIQTYLTQENPLNYKETLERIPVLEHWLTFFGVAGEEVVAQLQNRLKQEGQANSQDTAMLDEPFAQASLQGQSETVVQSAQTASQEEVSKEEYHPPFIEAETLAEPVSQGGGVGLSEADLQTRISDIFSGDEAADESEERSILEMPSARIAPIVEHVDALVEDIQMPVISVSEPVQEKPSQSIPLTADSEPVWRINKIFKQTDFVVAVQAWISARCHELGYTDYYTYRYYGFLVDVIDTTIEELKAILSDTSLYDLIEQRQTQGVHFLQNQLIAFEKESKEAHEGVLADLSPLPRENLSVDDLKRNLGLMDTSSAKEYLGPAPDGFEVVDDPYASLDDATLEKEYAKIEKTGALPDMPTQPIVQPIVEPVVAQITTPAEPVVKNQAEPIKNTSQIPQNGVQRKMTFNLGPKKPAGSGSTDS